MSAQPDVGILRLLFVCTGNICRSPSAEYLLRARLEAKLGPTAEQIVLGSAGLGTPGDWHIDPKVAELLAGAGIDGTEKFRSRPVTSEVLAQAGLILTGTKRHRLMIGSDFPEAYSRTFTMREAVALLEHADAAGLPQFELLDRGRAVIELLQRERGNRAVAEDDLDIADPHGRRMPAYRQMFDEVRGVVDSLAFVLAPATVRVNQRRLR